MYFTLHPKRVIIVAAYVKKSQKLPVNEKEKAEKRMKAALVAEEAKIKAKDRPKSEAKGRL